jgi:DNA polymerase
MKRLSIDFETYSEENIKKAGALRYAEHPSTRPLCMAYALEGEEPSLWLPGEPLPAVFKRDDVLVYAWNALFEIAIWPIAFPDDPIPLEKWRCSMATGAYNGYPLALVQAAAAAGGEYKSMTGGHVIRKCCKPGGNPTDQDFDDLYTYCLQDVRAERSVVDSCLVKELPEQEQEIWSRNIRMALRGVRVDMYLVRALQGIRARESKALEERMQKLIGLKPTQTGKLAVALGLKSTSKAHLEKVLKNPEIPPVTREAIEIRLQAAKTSLAKLDAIENTIMADGRIHGMVEYFAAHTGRFGGRLVQLQNLPRGSFKVTPEMVELALNYPSSVALVEPPLEFCSTLLRGCLVPGRGKNMYAGDYGQIEARVLAWYAGSQDLLSGFSDPGRDLYVEFGSRHGLDRQGGKTAILGLGFQMGKQRFQATLSEWGAGDFELDHCKEIVDGYRSDYPEVPEFWKACLRAYAYACIEPGKVIAGPGFRTFVKDGYLVVVLPSGRHLIYKDPEFKRVEKTWPDGSTSKVPTVTYSGKNSYTQKWETKNLYGGLICENVVQSTARDLMCFAMGKLEEAGFSLLFSVHDEVIVEGEPGREQEFLEVMSQKPEWCQDLPVLVEGGALSRYQK